MIKSNLSLALIVLAFLGGLMALQVSNVAAQSATQFTNPITPPISYYTYFLRGKISYKITRRAPKLSVAIEAKNTSTNDLFTTKADRFGNYSLTVTQKEASQSYIIKPRAGKNTEWQPAQYSLNVNRDYSDLNFTGIINK